MGYLERNSETWKTPGFSGFECRVSGIGRVSIFGFGQQKSQVICPGFGFSGSNTHHQQVRTYTERTYDGLRENRYFKLV